MKPMNDHFQLLEYERAEELFISGRSADAFPLISQFAEQGNPRAQYVRACFYHMGYDTVLID